MHLSLSRRRATVAATALTAAAVAAAFSAPGGGTTGTPATYTGINHLRPQAGAVGDESKELLTEQQQWNDARLAPSGSLYDGAYTAAYNSFASMDTLPASWTELTNKAYNADDPNYADANWSNSGGGAKQVSGRITSLAYDAGSGRLYAGAAGGGVWRSTDRGAHWTAIGDQLPGLAIGSLAVDPSGNLWVGTGEGNTNSDGYTGSGVYELPGGNGQLTTANHVGGTELDNHTVRNLRLAGSYVFAATNRGVYRHAASASTAPWTLVLAPCSGVGTAAVSCTGNSTYQNIANDLAVQPHTGKLVAELGWRGGSGGGTEYNGFYYSTNNGASWTRANPTGALNKDIGNATLGYAADGSKLYTVVESPTALLKGSASVLNGIYVSNSGDPNGPWSLAANSSTLAQSGSAERKQNIGPGYQPGVQAWYNQFVGVDPANPNHVYVGLEEVYESWNAGKTWTTAARYWNFGMACYSPTNFASCDGNVTHSDQHAVTFGAGNVFIGNDGGAYGRPTTQKVGWNDLNASGTLNTLQYYAADAGPGTGGAVDVWGGLQDNGQSLMRNAPSATSGTPMVSPVGGDGGDQLVNKANGCESLGEYTNLETQLSVNCGESGAGGANQVVYDIAPGDPNARFIAPFEPTVNPSQASYWVAGGQFVWENDKTFSSRNSTDWTMVGDTGDYANGVAHSATAVSAMTTPTNSHVVWAGWCSGSCSPVGFKRGVATNAGTGTWHQAAMTGLPNRYIGGLVVDPSDSTGASAYAVMSGFSRKWQSGPGADTAGLGHVFVTHDGGDSWTSIDKGSGTTTSFPDVPANDVRVLSNGDVVVATDFGVAVRTTDGNWHRVGSNLPSAPVDGLSFYNGVMYAATHGRGIWTVATPGGAAPVTPANS